VSSLGFWYCGVAKACRAAVGLESEWKQWVCVEGRSGKALPLVSTIIKKKGASMKMQPRFKSNIL